MSDVVTWPNGVVVDTDSIRANADAAQRICEAEWEADGSLRSPDWVIQALAQVSYHAARMVVVIERAEELKRRAATRLERAKATARWQERDLSGTLLSARVVLLTADEKDAYDDAVIAFEYARRIGNLLKDYTSRVQSIGKQIEILYKAGA